jgi:hypothetical protein
LEFWNSDITEESWRRLQELRKEFDFVLIGGWAVYLYTKLHKSKDIDIIIDYPTLRKISALYRTQKNDRLSKYEIRLERFDIDVYLPKYSKLSLPAEEILEGLNTNVEGFRVPTPEALMTLKLGAASERGESIKGEKDAVDILRLLFFSHIDMKKFKRMIEAHGIGEYARLLLTILRTADRRMAGYLNLNEKRFSELKKKYEKIILEVL